MSVSDPTVEGHGEQDPAPSVVDVGQGPQPILSPADVLRAAYVEAQAHREPKDIKIPGYGEPDSELHVTFQMVDDYEDLRDGIRRVLAQKALRPAQREVQMGIETMKAAALGSYAVVNGSEHDLGHPLGLDLHEALGSPGVPEDAAGPTNDAQAIFLLFHSSTTLIMTAFTELDQWIKRGGRDSEEEALGN